MSSIRLFVLDTLERHGEVHGHQLRLLAEQEHVHLWTDISVGALYGAIKRLAAEGLVAEVRTERPGSYPERQVYGITDAGRTSLAELRRSTAEHVAFKPDPFDLALSRPDPDRLDELAGVVAGRLEALQALLAETRRNNERARPYLSTGEAHAMAHREHRLTAEIRWHHQLLADMPDVVADERARALSPETLPTAALPKDIR
ncbi:PadR family transcriptional regulator [uncultured Friedmanniella sp.]|uniref:PadR family transcriptional regulator n=1 Tax=uncultured Friedmanniella sp. TaxID=335381 RepID=UPI0035CA5290